MKIYSVFVLVLCVRSLLLTGHLLSILSHPYALYRVTLSASRVKRKRQFPAAQEMVNMAMTTAPFVHMPNILCIGEILPRQPRQEVRTLWVFVKVIVETRMKTVEKASSATNEIYSKRCLDVMVEGRVAETTAFPNNVLPENIMCTIVDENFLSRQFSKREMTPISWETTRTVE